MVFGRWNPWKKKNPLDVSQYLREKSLIERGDLSGTIVHIPPVEFEKYKGLSKDELFKKLEDRFQTKIAAIEVIGIMVIWKEDKKYFGEVTQNV